MTTDVLSLQLGPLQLAPEIVDGDLRSLGAVTVCGTPLRNPTTRFLPWFDSYEGDIFRRFAFQGMESRGGTTVLRTRAISDPDTLFRERRDCSGDPCFRAVSWDGQPQEATLDICLEPALADVEGLHFTGFRYWFEYSGGVPIHRLVDRQTWEVGGNLDDVQICLRNWLTPPRMRITRETTYSTVGLDKWAGLLPGNLWGRWSLLPSFDMQYGAAGVLLGWFDAVSLIRTVIESNAGENALRCLDMHLFTQDTQICTTPKTILWSPEVLDDTDALNLWTRVVDQERIKAQQQFALDTNEPPAIIFSQNHWRDFHFDHSYEQVVEVAAEFAADYVFIDPVWEHQQAYKETLDALIPAEKQQGTILEKFWQQNMCVTLDFEVAEIIGGERSLKALCDRARAKGVQVMSWMAAHYSPNSTVQFLPEMTHGMYGIFAAKESGRHPDTGYAAGCWTANLNSPIYEHLTQQLLGVCERTGLAGFLWDSFSNMGWWQVDYSDGTMRPQFDKMMALYVTLTNAGLYIMPEAIVSFCEHSCCGLHGGNVYAGDLLGYSYATNIGMESAEFIDGAVENDLREYDQRLVRGEVPIDLFFRTIAHKRMTTLGFHIVPREQWHLLRVEEIKYSLAGYKRNRDLMRKRTVLKGDCGVLWENDTDTVIFFSFADQASPLAGTVTDGLTGERVAGTLKAYRIYRIDRI